MTEAEMFKMAEKFDEEFKPADLPLKPEQDENFNQSFVQNVGKTEQKTFAKQKKKRKDSSFKDNYFAFYNDIKTSSNHKTEW